MQRNAPKQDVIQPRTQVRYEPQVEKITLPVKPSSELFSESKKCQTDLKSLIKQLSFGCGNSHCTNKESCSSANSSLRDANPMMTALKMQI